MNLNLKMKDNQDFQIIKIKKRKIENIYHILLIYKNV